MARKIFLWGMLLVFIGAIAYGYLHYAVIGLYEPGQPKISYLFIIKKPERGIDFWYNHIDEKDAVKQLEKLDSRGLPPPWHLDYDWVVANSVYHFTMDNRQFASGSPLQK